MQVQYRCTLFDTSNELGNHLKKVGVGPLTEGVAYELVGVANADVTEGVTWGGR